MALDRKKIGMVTTEERNEIKALFERKNGLNELFRSLAELGNEELINGSLYDRLVKDMGEVSTKFQSWWDEKSSKYQWENKPGYHWEIDFNTCEIFLK